MNNICEQNHDLRWMGSKVWFTQVESTSNPGREIAPRDTSECQDLSILFPRRVGMSSADAASKPETLRVIICETLWIQLINLADVGLANAGAIPTIRPDASLEPESSGSLSHSRLLFAGLSALRTVLPLLLMLNLAPVRAFFAAVAFRLVF